MAYTAAAAVILGWMWLVLTVGVWATLAAELRPEPVEPVVFVVPAPQIVTAQVAAAEAEAVTVPAEAWEWRRMEATAYTSGPESTGKRPGHPLYGITRSGLPTRPGVVAVDPDVIPLGSIVWVEGYGLAVALDTGSAIRGNRVDVWFEDVQTALAWGRREVWVGVLDAHYEAVRTDVEAAAR